VGPARYHHELPVQEHHDRPDVTLFFDLKKNVSEWCWRRRCTRRTAGSPIFNINHARSKTAFNTKKAIVSIKQNCRGSKPRRRSRFLCQMRALNVHG
jgi:hypothetical protein